MLVNGQCWLTMVTYVTHMAFTGCNGVLLVNVMAEDCCHAVDTAYGSMQDDTGGVLSH